MGNDDIAELTSEIYKAPLAEFTDRRNELAKRLKTGGDDEAAERVRVLRKPKLSAWAVNQLVRRKKSEVQELVSTTDEVASAKDAATMREAATRRHSIVGSLADVASSILKDAGHAATATTVQEIVQTLQATADPEARGLILRGDLSEPLTVPGFGLTGDLSTQEPIEHEAHDPGEEKRREEIGKLERALRKARKAVEEAGRAAERARTRADAAETEATEAALEVERLEGALIEAKGKT